MEFEVLFIAGSFRSVYGPRSTVTLLQLHYLWNTMQRIETNSAVVQRVSPHVMECRYKPGVKVDAVAVRENLQARKQLDGTKAYGVIGIFPEDVDFDMSLLYNDHYREAGVDEWTRVLAIVSEGMLFERLAKLYFTYHPTNFSTKVFNDLEEARAWVEQCMSEHGG